MLLVAAGVTLQKLWELRTTDLGFEPSGVLTFRTDPPWTHYGSREQTAPFHRRAVEELERLPGIKGAAMNTNPPLAAHQAPTESIRVFGQSVDEVERNPFVNLQITSPNYFEVFGVSLLEGTAYTAFDDALKPQKAVTRRAPATSSLTDRPCTRTEPDTGSRSPRKVNRVVDLPAPLPPSRA